MPRNVSTTLENNFTKGLITETTGVNSPENSVTQSDNFVFDRRGRAVRRLGIDYEDGHVATNINLSTTNTGVIAEYLWETVANSASIEFIVIQIANKLLFYKNTGGTISTQKTTFEIDLLPFKVSTWADSLVFSTQVSFSTGNGKLFVVHSYCEPFYVTYDITTNTVATTQVAVSARDFEGVIDTLDISNRPTTLTILHKYNLWNQGWWQKVEIRAIPVLAYTTIQAIDGWRSNVAGNRTDYPSNCDVWWYYKGALPAIPAANVPEFVDIFLTNQIAKVAIGNTPAPKGHFVFSAWDTARSTVVDETGNALGGTVPETSSNGARPSVVAFYYGRVFYAGVRNNAQASSIYFTQIVERDDQYGNCYQTNDPTSEKAFDLLPSDGGVIKIPDIVNILEMKVFGPSLFIFASNGVWAVTGSNNSSFKATDYQVKKIGDFAALSKNSIVDVSGSPIWWNADAIYNIDQSQSVYDASINNVSIQSIQTFFDNIPLSAKQNAKAGFDQLDGLVYWLYRQEPVVNTGDEYRYDHILVLDVVTKAFYSFSFSNTPRAISGIVPVRNTDNRRIFKFLTTGLIDTVSRGLTFSELNSDVMSDWISSGTPSPFDSSFITGYRIRGDLLKKFQTNYLTVITDNSLLQSGFVQGVWDYTNNVDSSRFTNPQQVYRPRFFYADYQRVRVKIRGSGYSLQFKFYSDSDKPMSIVGWATFETANAQP